MWEKRTIEHGGVRLDGILYFHPKLLLYAGKSVLVKRKKQHVKVRNKYGIPICVAKADLFK